MITRWSEFVFSLFDRIAAMWLSLELCDILLIIIAVYLHLIWFRGSTGFFRRVWRFLNDRL